MAQSTDSSDLSPIEPDISPIPCSVAISPDSTISSSPLPPPSPPISDSSQIPSPLSLSPSDSLQQQLPLQQPLHLRLNSSDPPLPSVIASSPPSLVDNRITAPPQQPPLNRCRSCRKRVGLLGFKCRCGDLFCSSHRYSDLHNCSFDYKSAGRAAIARENPVITARKIVKI